MGVKRSVEHVWHRYQARVQRGTERLVRKAIQYAIDNDKPSVTTIVHKGI
jgi:isocitrate dehydrogenase